MTENHSMPVGEGIAKLKELAEKMPPMPWHVGGLGCRIYDADGGHVGVVLDNDLALFITALTAVAPAMIEVMEDAVEAFHALPPEAQQAINSAVDDALDPTDIGVSH